MSWSDLSQRMVKQVKSAGQGTAAAAAAAAFVRGGLTVCPDGALTPDVRARMMSGISAAAGCACDALSWSEGVDVGGGKGGSGGLLHRRSISLFTPHPRAHGMLRQAAQRVLQLVEVGAYVHWYTLPLTSLNLSHLLPPRARSRAHALHFCCAAGTSSGAASGTKSLKQLKWFWNRVIRRPLCKVLKAASVAAANMPAIRATIPVFFRHKRTRARLCSIVAPCVEYGLSSSNDGRCRDRSRSPLLNDKGCFTTNAVDCYALQ